MNTVKTVNTHVIVIRCRLAVFKRVVGGAAGGGPRRLRSTGSTGEDCESVEVRDP